MKKFSIAIISIFIFGLLFLAGAFSYIKFKEADIAKKQLKIEQQSNKNTSDSESKKQENNIQNESNTSDNTNKSNQNQIDLSNDYNGDGVISMEEMTPEQEKLFKEGKFQPSRDYSEPQNKDNSSVENVTRDNVFDYVIAAVNNTEDGDASKLKFYEPEKQGSDWKVPATNKSGAGGNTFIVHQDGHVEIWNGPMTTKFSTEYVAIADK